jgi:hypothetical protein
MDGWEARRGGHVGPVAEAPELVGDDRRDSCGDDGRMRPAHFMLQGQPCKPLKPCKPCKPLKPCKPVQAPASPCKP